MSTTFLAGLGGWHARSPGMTSRPSRRERGGRRAELDPRALRTGPGQGVGEKGAPGGGERRGVGERRRGREEREAAEHPGDPQASAPEDARPQLRAPRRDAERRPLPASEQPRPGQGRGESLAAAGGPRRSPRRSAAPASLRPAAPRHLPNLCPTMARPHQPLPVTTSGAEGEP